MTAIPTAADKAFPKYEQIFVIIEENKGYDQIIYLNEAGATNKGVKPMTALFAK